MMKASINERPKWIVNNDLSSTFRGSQLVMIGFSALSEGSIDLDARFATEAKALKRLDIPSGPGRSRANPDGSGYPRFLDLGNLRLFVSRAKPMFMTDKNILKYLSLTFHVFDEITAP